MFKIYFALTISVISISMAGNLVRLCGAHPFIIAFYRLIFALIILFPFFLPKFLKSYKKIPLKIYLKIALMGVVFVAHFYGWFYSIYMTKVANATITFATNPAFIALGAYLFLKEKLDRYIWFSIIMGIVGVIILGFEDFTLSPKYFLGDLLALFAGIIFSIYFLIGKSLRDNSKVNIDNIVLMYLVYFFAATVASAVVLFSNLKILDIDQRAFWSLIALTIFPTILGHVLLIYVLKEMKASIVSAATFVEPVVAGVAAYFLFTESLTVRALMGYLFIVIGLSILVFTRDRVYNRNLNKIAN
ncbi:MAG: DMT family transporter [Oligoflexia bacterium]|nr:DMT family transporter [Oligoflexia bacterium]